MQAEVEHLLHVARGEHRHAQAREQRLGRARQRGGLAARVVAHQGQRAARARHADEVAVAERVGGAVEAGRLAVPDAQHAVVARAGERPASWLPQTAVAPSSSFRPGVEDVMLGAQLAAALELLVEPAERRARVAGDERAGVQAAAASARCWSSTSRTSAWMPVRRIRPSSSTVPVVEGDLAEGGLAGPRGAAPPRLSRAAAYAGQGGREARSDSLVSPRSMLAASLWLTELPLMAHGAHAIVARPWTHVLHYWPVPVDVKGNTRYGQE